MTTDLQGCLSIDDEVFQALVRDWYANTADFLRAYFHFHFSRVVDEDTIVSVGDIERNTFVCLITGSSSILIPDFDRLACESGQKLTTKASLKKTSLDWHTILHKCTKLLSKSIDKLARGNVQLRIDIPNNSRQRLRSWIGWNIMSQTRAIRRTEVRPMRRDVKNSLIFRPRRSENTVRWFECDWIRVFGDLSLEITTGDNKIRALLR